MWKIALILHGCDNRLIRVSTGFGKTLGVLFNNAQNGGVIYDRDSGKFFPKFLHSGFSGTYKA
jgi:hypothetical protein